MAAAHSRRHLYVTSYTGGFSHFVTSMTAPVASGWSGCRVQGLHPLESAALARRTRQAAIPESQRPTSRLGKARSVARASQATNFPLAERKAGQRIGQWRHVALAQFLIAMML